MESFLLKGILIGLLFGVPAGAVGATTVQRTLSLGLKEGLLTGLGSSSADCFYAVVGAFGLTVISDFLLTYKTAIHLTGGCLILIMESRLLFGKKEISYTGRQTESGVKMFLTSFVMA